jgi:hypothetical protein
MDGDLIMTDPAIIAASYTAERNYSHNPDDVIDASDAVGAWGTAKESTTELVDLSGNNNIGTIHGAMPTEGFIQGRRFTAANNNQLNCGNDSSLDIQSDIIIEIIGMFKSLPVNQRLIEKGAYNIGGYRVYKPADQSKLGFDIHTTAERHVITSAEIGLNKIFHAILIYNSSQCIYLNGELDAEYALAGDIKSVSSDFFIGVNPENESFNGEIYYIGVHLLNNIDTQKRFNTIARLPFWSVNYTDYPDNVTEYTDRLPYSSSIISSGTFKVNDDKLQCVSAGTITYSASYEFDGSEYIKVEIDGVEYAGTGTITQGNTTVAIIQGSNKVTIQAGTDDTIDSINVQFREEV